MKKRNQKEKRRIRVRAKIKGTTERPRLSVFRSNKYIYCQIIDDTKGITLAAANGKNPSQVGESIAKKALEKGIKAVIFDRGHYCYHGRVKALAEGARKGGLKF